MSKCQFCDKEAVTTVFDIYPTCDECHLKISEKYPPVKCACGCGEVRPPFDSQGIKRKYILGHKGRTQKYFNQFSKEMKECACGCGLLKKAYLANGYPTGPFKSGHASGVKSVPDAEESRKARQMRKARAVLSNIPRECKLKSGFCTKQTSPHHLNRDLDDNAEDNLIWLCYSHKMIAVKQNLWDLQSIRDEERHYYNAKKGKKRFVYPKDIMTWK